MGQYTSVTIGADGLGLISYYDATNGDLKVAHCSKAAGTPATTATPDRASDDGRATSVTTGAAGRGLSSCQEGTNGSLRGGH